MLVAIVIHLLKRSKQQPEKYAGRQAQAWFLQQIAQINPALAEELHTENITRPYTISGLLGPITSNTENSFAIRITSISPHLSQLIVNELLPSLSQKTINIDHVDFVVNNFVVDSEQDEWANISTFEKLAQESVTREIPSSSPHIQMQFVTPTSFRSQSIDVPFPLPEYVFRSLWVRWNSFCPSEFQVPQDFLEQLEKLLVTSNYNLHTEKIQFSGIDKRAATGFIGNIDFTLRKSKVPEDVNSWQRFASVTKALALFSLFSGVGHHTTIGLGQTKASLDW